MDEVYSLLSTEVSSRIEFYCLDVPELKTDYFKRIRQDYVNLKKCLGLLKNCEKSTLLFCNVKPSVLLALRAAYVTSRIRKYRLKVQIVLHANAKSLIGWCISNQELSIYQEMLRGLEGMLEGLVEEMNIKTDITDDWLWSMAHHSGTVSMGDAEEDLVDSDLRLKCCPNVFVCDGSVIQEHSYANTGLTIGQLALRLAEKIKNMAKQ